MAFGSIIVLFISICIFARIAMYLLQKNAAVKANAADFAEMDKQKAEAFDKRLNELVPNPSNTPTVTEIAPLGKEVVFYGYHIWVENNALHFFPSTRYVTSDFGSPTRMEDNRIKHTVIPFDKILCYRQIGEVYTTVEGSGGESTYSLFTGVHGKINPVKITTEVHDKRTTQLFYDDGTKDVAWVFRHDDFYTFKKLLPEKDYDVVNALIIEKAEAKQPRMQSVQQRLATLKDLYEQELITKEEFENKRAEIISEL